MHGRAAKIPEPPFIHGKQPTSNGHERREQQYTLLMLFFTTKIQPVINKHAPLMTNLLFIRRPTPRLNDDVRATHSEVPQEDSRRLTAERTWSLPGHEQLWVDFLQTGKTSWPSKGRRVQRSPVILRIGPDITLPNRPNGPRHRKCEKASSPQVPCNTGADFAAFIHEQIASWRKETVSADAACSHTPDDWGVSFLTEADLLSIFHPYPKTSSNR